MHELRGFLDIKRHHLNDLKRQLLLFDHLYIFGIPRAIDDRCGMPASTFADLEFLSQKGVVTDLGMNVLDWAYPIDKEMPENQLLYKKSITAFLDRCKLRNDQNDNTKELLENLCLRLISALTEQSAGEGFAAQYPAYSKAFFEAAPICTTPLPVSIRIGGEQPSGAMNQVGLEIGLGALPWPDDTCSYLDILDFKNELSDKQLGFRRFLRILVTKTQNEAEIRDEIEWMVKEYRKAMEIHHIKASQSFVDVFVISPLEIIENLVKFNWSKIAKGALQVQKRRVELMEAEMKAPGRECAYVFDAQKRFGKHS
jgi:hypothetical protein